MINIELRIRKHYQRIIIKTITAIDKWLDHKTSPYSDAQNKKYE
ncbi:hypothetical protein [Nonlabens sp. YIK11]|nr:hypothetical protein [Nonlabens sp. YIK11]